MKHPTAASKRNFDFLDRLDAVAAPDIGPVRLGTRMSGHVDFEPLSSDWRGRIAREWWSGAQATNEETARCDPGLYGLRRGLLALGGAETCLPRQDPALSLLVSRGQVWSGATATVKQTGAVGPWQHSRDLWLSSLPSSPDAARKAASVIIPVIGYAMSDDGMWRQHAWCIESFRDGEARVVDSSQQRLMYFGAAYCPGRDALIAMASLNEQAQVSDLLDRVLLFADHIMSNAYDVPRVLNAQKRIAEDGLGMAPPRSKRWRKRTITPGMLHLAAGISPAMGE